jgi:hypothetical protein
MTKLPIVFSALAAALLLTASPTRAANLATLGEKVPDFTLQGADGKQHSLSDYKGKFVVLEWTNPDCPFVHKFYDSDTMQKLQKKYTSKGVVWLRVNSGAPKNYVTSALNEAMAGKPVAIASARPYGCSVKYAD